MFWYYGYIREIYSRLFFVNLGKSDGESIFKHTGVGSIFKEVVEKCIKLLIAKSKM